MTNSHDIAPRANIQRLIREGRRLKLGFVEAEIETSLALLSLAKTNRGLGYYEAADRGMEWARKGHSVAARMLDELRELEPGLRNSLSARIVFLGSELERQSPDQFLLQEAASGTAEPTAASPLSKRETEVLKLIVEGMSTKEIAGTLNISFRTAVCHRANAMKKLGVPNAAALVRKATVDHLV